MICPDCQGKGQQFSDTIKVFLLCMTCHGAGFAHCCEGERAQPECQIINLDAERNKRKEGSP